MTRESMRINFADFIGEALHDPASRPTYARTEKAELRSKFSA